MILDLKIDFLGSLSFLAFLYCNISIKLQFSTTLNIQTEKYEWVMASCMRSKQEVNRRIEHIKRIHSVDPIFNPIGLFVGDLLNIYQIGLHILISYRHL